MMSEFRSKLGDRLAYDPVTGAFKWLVKPSKNRSIDDPVGHRRHDGYLTIGMQGREYLGHRVAWFLMTGEFPEQEIDHIDGDPSNNKWNNLRLATRAENNRNTKGYSNTGIKNVYYREGKRNPFQVKIMVDGKNICVGSFTDLELAELVAEEARIKYHKEFAHE